MLSLSLRSLKATVTKYIFRCKHVLKQVLEAFPELPQRIPGLLLGLLYLFLASHSIEQISVLFSDNASNWGIFAYWVIALISSTSIYFLLTRRSRYLKLLDILIFFTPACALIWALHPFSRIAGFVSLGGMSLFVATYFLLSKVQEARFRRFVFFGVLSITLWVIVHFLIIESPIEFSRSLGTISLLFIFAGIFLVLLRLIFFRAWTGIPILLLAGISFWTNELHHFVRQVEYDENNYSDDTATHGPQPVSMQQAFEVWLTSRNDFEEYRSRGKPYPVFIVTSAGGGGYAAAHSYLFLSKMQQRCPNFAQHIFAIVGVSGGAVGNTLFWQGLPETTNYSEFQDCSESFETEQHTDVLAQDHLSPIVATMLFHDFPNKIWGGYLGPWDRSTALITSLSFDANVAATSNPPYFEHYWNHEPDNGLQLKEGPAIVQVATNSTSGRRYVFAPFLFRPEDGAFEQALNGFGLYGDAPSSDIRIIDAAVASASFPYINPSLSIATDTGKRINLVDGGYVDNSGAATARDILAELQDPNMWSVGLEIHSISAPKSFLGNEAVDNCNNLTLETRIPRKLYDEPEDYGDDCVLHFTLRTVTIRSEPSSDVYSSAQNFFLDPIYALFNARARRAEISRIGLFTQQCTGGNTCTMEVNGPPDIGFYDSVISPKDLELPLGWFLSRKTIERLEGVVAPDPNTNLEIPSCNDGENYLRYGRFNCMDGNPTDVGEIISVIDPMSK